ncbi:MAG TPA: hypothetical protein VKH63_06845 [Candidatus Acidoferrum sp.]|nr:hypothetical protein [Candidatus Acidoferrum sp.]
MRRTTAFAAAIVFAGIISVRGVTAAPAQSPCTSQLAPKLTPQERIVRRDIQAAIDEQIEELAAMDINAATRLMPKDFSNRLVDGTTLNRDQAIAGMCQENAGVLRVDIDRTYTHIECLHLAGKEAIVYTKQQYVRTVPDLKNSSPHEIITSVRHREIWTYTEDGWVKKRIEELEQGQTYLDGEPYDPR